MLSRAVQIVTSKAERHLEESDRYNDTGDILVTTSFWRQDAFFRASAIAASTKARKNPQPLRRLVTSTPRHTLSHLVTRSRSFSVFLDVRRSPVCGRVVAMLGLVPQTLRFVAQTSSMHKREIM